MTQLELSAALGYAAGMLLSVIFSYFPGLNTWYAGQEKWVKQLIMLGLLIVVGLLVFTAACAKIWHWVTCDQTGLMNLLFAIAAAMTGNQVTYKLTPQTGKVQREKENRHTSG